VTDGEEGGNMSERYHLAGIAGVGMSALAQVFLAQDCRVSGSDRHLDRGADLDALRKLRAAGVSLFPQDGSGLTPDTAALIVSTAVEEDNPDICAAKRMGIPVVHRAAALARCMGDAPAVAVTGTSGKSTVTGMIGWMLDRLNADPMVVNGAPVLNWVTPGRIGNTRPGDGTWAFEADESDRSLLSFSPDWAVITNVSKDHFGIEETHALFADFRKRVRKGVVDERTVADHLAQAAPTLSEGGSSFRYGRHTVRLRVPGRHNVENAIFAMALLEKLGYDVAQSAKALESFLGIQRRLETVGEARGVRVVDDYAHNPAKIRAAWETMATSCSRLLAVWRPHGYGPLRAMMEELETTFAALCRPGDVLFLLPVYDAGGTADRSVHSGHLADRLASRGIRAEVVAEVDSAVSRAAAWAKPGDAVLVMGARDPDLPRLARRILEALAGGSTSDQDQNR